MQLRLPKGGSLKPFAFFFNGKHETLGMEYGPPCTSRIIKAIENSKAEVRTQVLRGDLLPHDIAYKISSVAVEKQRNGRSVTHTMSPDMELYKLVLCDFADSLKHGWCTVDVKEFPYVMARNRIWTIVLPTISEEVAQEIDASLKTFPPYLGATSVDTGNPIHVRFFSLVGGAFFDRESLFYQAQMGDPEEDLAVAKRYGATKPVVLAFDDYEKQVPPSLTSATLSARGTVSAERISGKSKPSHREKLARELLDYLHTNPQIVEFDFTTELAPEQHEFVCKEAKIKSYLLNLEHPNGKSKAKFFLEYLGIEQEDWRYLADQICGGMETAVLYRVSNNPYGVTHGAYIEINGRNGRTALIETGWIIEGDKSASFVTAYPYSGELETKPNAPPENIAPMHLEGDNRWADIYKRAQLAGDAAAKACIPTPMTLVDYEPIFAGQCGFAWITVHDARKGMARWLKKNGIGHNNYRSGWDISANPVPPEGASWDFQSIEPKTAYAKAFARVLEANGVHCVVESRLD